MVTLQENTFVPLRSVLSGAMVSLALAFLIMQPEALIASLAQKNTIKALLDHLIKGETTSSAS